jgi:hypothetical protein
MRTGAIGKFSEHRIGTSGSVKGEKHFDWQNDYQIIKKASITHK